MIIGKISKLPTKLLKNPNLVALRYRENGYTIGAYKKNIQTFFVKDIHQPPTIVDDKFHLALILCLRGEHVYNEFIHADKTIVKATITRGTVIISDRTNLNWIDPIRGKLVYHTWLLSEQNYKKEIKEIFREFKITKLLITDVRYSHLN